MQMLNQLQDRRKRNEQAPAAERTEGSQPRPRGVKERCGTAVHISSVDAYREEYGARVPCQMEASQPGLRPTDAGASVDDGASKGRRRRTNRIAVRQLARGCQLTSPGSNGYGSN